MPGTVYRCKISYLVKESDANPPEGDTKPPEDSASMKFVYHQLNWSKISFYWGPFKNYVDKMRWVGGQKMLLFVHV